MSKQHIIKDYEQAKYRLASLSSRFNTSQRDYNFAVGDLLNEITPSKADMPSGMNPVLWQQRISAEFERLLRESGTDFGVSYALDLRSTARAWPKAERKYDAPFTAYRYLSNHKDLMRDGLTGVEAQALLRERTLGNKTPFDSEVRKQMQRDMRRSKTYNPTQRLRIGINNLRSVLDHDDGSPLDEEQVALIGEAYAVLDAYCERKGIDMYEPELMAA